MAVEPSTSEFSLFGKTKGYLKFARTHERKYRSLNDNNLDDNGDGVFKDENVCNSSTSKYKMKKKNDSNEESESYCLNSTEEFNFCNGVTLDRSINNEVNCLSKKKKNKHKRKLVELEEDSFNTDAAKKSKKRRLFSPSNDKFSEKEVTTSKKKKRSEQCSLDETLNEFKKPEKRTSNGYLNNTIEPNSSFKEKSRDDVYEFSRNSQEKENRALNSSKAERSYDAEMFSTDDFNTNHYISKKRKKKKKKKCNHTESYDNADEETNNDTLTSLSNFLEQQKNNDRFSEKEVTTSKKKKRSEQCSLDETLNEFKKPEKRTSNGYLSNTIEPNSRFKEKSRDDVYEFSRNSQEKERRALNSSKAERSYDAEMFSTDDFNTSHDISKKKKKKKKRNHTESYDNADEETNNDTLTSISNFLEQQKNNDILSEKEVTTSKKKKRSEQCSLDETLNEFKKPEKRTSNSYLSNSIEPNSNFKEKSKDDAYEFSSSSQEKERRALSSSKAERSYDAEMFSNDDFNTSHDISKKKKKKKKRNDTESYDNPDEETNNDTLTSISNFLEQQKNNDILSEKEVTTSKKKKRSEQCSLDETLNEFKKPEKRTSNSYLSNSIEPNSNFKEKSKDDVYEFSSSSQEKERRALNSSKAERSCDAEMFSNDDFNTSYDISKKKKKKKKKKRNDTESYDNPDEETNNDTLTSISNFLEQQKNNGVKSEHTEEFIFSQDLFSQSAERGPFENEVENSGNHNEDSVIDDSTTITKKKTRKQKKSNNNETISNVNKFKDFWDVEQNYKTEENALIALDLDIENIPELHKRSLQNINDDEIRSLKDKGIYVKQGRWSFEEKSTLKANWHKLYKNYKDFNLNELFFQRTRTGLKRSIVQYLGQGLSTRTPLAIYQKTRELFGKRVSGRFTDLDKDKVKELVSLHGRKWKTIGEYLDRNGKSVFDVYQKIKSERNCGVWRDEEKRSLIKAIKDIVGEDEFTFDNKKVFVSLPWKKIAKIVKTRNVNQCRQEWLTNIYKVLLTKEEAEIVKMWDDSDNRKLIKRMKKLKVKDHNDIDWYKLAEKFRPINFFLLRLKFLTLRSAVSDYEQKPFTMVLDEISNFYGDC